MPYLFKNKILAIVLSSVFFLQQIAYAAGDTVISPGVSFQSSVSEANNIMIDSTLANVENISVSDNSDTIINIQDCHSSLSSQYSIVKILESLMNDYDVNIVAVEGGTGYIDTSVLKSYPDKAIRDKTAEYLMERSYISAGEFFAVTRDEDIAVYGVENDDLYMKNMEMFREIHENSGKNIAVMSYLADRMARQEFGMYNEDLRQVVYRSRLHRSGKLGLNVYWSFLSQIAGKKNISLRKYRNVRSFTELVEFEKRIDFDKATAERKEIINRLVDILPEEQLNGLVRKTVELEENKISKPDYYNGLLALVEKLNIKVEEYRELSKYADYIHRYWNLDVAGIQSELDEAQTLVTESLFEFPEQKEFYEVQVFIELLKDLFVVKLSPKEVAFIAGKASGALSDDPLEFLLDKGIAEDSGGLFTVDDIRGVFRSAERYMSFYEVASRRDSMLLSNTIKAMKTEGKNVAALITGGYHSNGLAGIMKEKGLSYLVLMPRTFEDRDRPYVAILTKKAQPIKEIAKSGEYSLALEVGISKNEEHFKEMLAFIIGQNLIKGKHVKPEINRWLDLIGDLRGKISANRLEKMQLVPVDLDRLHNWLQDVTYEQEGSDNSFRIRISEDTYIVSESSLDVLGPGGVDTVKNVNIPDLFDVIKDFGKSLDDLIASKDMDDAIVKFSGGITRVMFLVWRFFWEVTQYMYGVVSVRSAKQSVKVVLVNLFNPEGRHLTVGFPISVESMAGDLRAKYGDMVEVEIIDMQQGISIDRVIEKLKKDKIDIFGLSVKTGEQNIAKSILNKIHADTFPKDRIPVNIVVGGHRPRVYADEFLKAYEDIIVCQGEGEPTMRGLVELSLGKRRSLKDVPNIRYMDRTAKLLVRPKETDWEQLDFDDYVMPSIDTLKYVNQAGGIVYWETSRGCTWGKCKFCNRFFCRHTTSRVVPVETIVEGLEMLSKKGVEHVFFADTDFLQDDTERMKKLASEIITKKEKGFIAEELNFWIQTRAAGIYTDPGKDDSERKLRISEENDNKYEALKLLKKAGLGKIFIGVETGSETQLQRYNKGSNVSSIAGAIEKCRALDVQIEVGLIPIGPFMRLEELRETVDFVENTEISDSVVKVLNLMCVEENTDYYNMVSGGLPEKGYNENLITGPRDENTLLFPWRMKDPNLEIIKKTATDWMRENELFVYALRRIVDATEVKSSAEYNLRYFRRVDFTLLKGLVHICSIEASGDKKEQRKELEEFKNLSLIDKTSVDELAGYIEERVIKEQNEESRRRARNFAVGKLIELIRSARNRGLELVEEDIRKGEIKGPTEFLARGISRIREGMRKIPRLLPAQENFQIVLGLPRPVYDKIGEREIRRLRAGIEGISDIIALDYNLKRGEDLDEINEKGRMRRLLEDLKIQTMGRRCISAILDVEEIDENIESVIKEFVRKAGRDVPRYVDPSIPLDEQDVMNIDTVGSFDKTDIKNILIRRHPHEESIHLDQKSIYDLRIEEIRQSLKERDYSDRVKNYLSEADEEIKDSRNFVVTTVDELLDIKLLAGAFRERKNKMYGRKDAEEDLIKDFIVIKNESITRENKDDVLIKTGIYDYLSPEQIIVLEKDETLELNKLKSFIGSVSDRKWGVRYLSWKNIAIAEKAKLLDVNRSSLPEFLREDEMDNLLYVKLGEVDDKITGIVSQLYKMTLEIMANKDEVRYISNDELSVEKGYLYFIYIPKARAFDYDAEVISYESYVLRSL